MQVTVIMGFHDEAGTVRAAIESLRAQSYGAWDCVIVDDASQEAQRVSLLEAVNGDGRFQVLHNPKNLGLAASLNRGIAAAAGELIARMDADDRCLPSRLERQVAFLQSNPEVSVVGTAAWKVDRFGQRIGLLTMPEGHEEISRTIFRRTPFVHPSVMMRKSFLERVGGYDPRFRRAQDADLWLRGLRHGRYHNLPEPLLEYCWSPTLSSQRLRYGLWALLKGGVANNRPFDGAVAAGLLCASVLKRNLGFG